MKGLISENRWTFGKACQKRLEIPEKEGYEQVFHFLRENMVKTCTPTFKHPSPGKNPRVL
jgi:hypothetical protein